MYTTVHVVIMYARCIAAAAGISGSRPATRIVNYYCLSNYCLLTICLSIVSAPFAVVKTSMR